MDKEGKYKIIDEHFWFTATTIGINGFLITSSVIQNTCISIKIWSTIISTYASFLIFHRSAAHANKFIDCLPETLTKLPQKEWTCKHRAIKTKIELFITIKHVPYVFCAMSGALFYLLLVISSCFAVWYY